MRQMYLSVYTRIYTYIFNLHRPIFLPKSNKIPYVYYLDKCVS